MIQEGTFLNVADNTGAKLLKCIKVLGGTKRRYAKIADIIVGVVKKGEPRRPVKRHEVVRAVIIRQKKALRRPDGSYVLFDDNAVVILQAKTKEPRGGRVFGPVAKELKEQGFDKIASMAEELV